MATFTDRRLTLLAHTPALARRVRYVGAAAGAFEAALTARNPAAALCDDQAEAMVLEDLGALAEDLALIKALAPGGVLAAILPPGVSGRAQFLLGLLAALGVTVDRLFAPDPDPPYFDDGAGDLLAARALSDLPAEASEQGLVVVGRKAAKWPDPLAVHVVAFAPELMDIRTRLPATTLRSDPSLRVVYQRPPLRLPPAPPEAPKVLVLQRPAERSLEVWRRSIVHATRRGWPVVIEQDDHPDLIAAAKRQPVAELEWTRLALVHAVQTSTPQLAAVFRPLNPEVAVFPNAVFALGPPPGPRPRRVFYGAVNRGPFAAKVARSLAPVIRRFPDVEFVVVRDQAVFDALPTNRKTLHPALPYEAYLELMAGCAVSLSPIAAAPHTDTKSDAKFLDAASRGVVTLASPNVYRSTIRHRETGLIAERPEDWPQLLMEVLGDEPFRRRLAEAAYAYVRDERMFVHQIEQRRDWYRSLWARRHELTAALAERMASAPVPLL